MSPTGRSFRVVRACVRFACHVRSMPKIRVPSPSLSLLWGGLPFSLEPPPPPPNLLSSFSWPYRYLPWYLNELFFDHQKLNKINNTDWKNIWLHVLDCLNLLIHGLKQLLILFLPINCISGELTTYAIT